MFRPATALEKLRRQQGTQALKKAVRYGCDRRSCASLARRYRIYLQTLDFGRDDWEEQIQNLPDS